MIETNKGKLIFLELKNHAWLGRVFSKLTESDIRLCLSFIEKNIASADFDRDVQRMFIDVADKPKNWKHIMELLTCFYSVYRKQK